MVSRGVGGRGSFKEAGLQGFGVAGATVGGAWDAGAGSLLVGVDGTSPLAPLFPDGVAPGPVIGAGLFPALSGKDGCRVRWNMGQRPFRHAPPPSFLPWADAALGKVKWGCARNKARHVPLGFAERPALDRVPAHVRACVGVGWGCRGGRTSWRAQGTPPPVWCRRLSPSRARICPLPPPPLHASAYPPPPSSWPQPSRPLLSPRLSLRFWRCGAAARADPTLMHGWAWWGEAGSGRGGAAGGLRRVA